MKTFPTLYKKTSTGKIQYWKIFTESNTIITQYGQVDGKQQETRDVINEGKNLGKSNATTPIEQAELEAQSKWEQKLKKGYVKTIDNATAGKVNEEMIQGGYFPMLAQSFSKHSHKITYPAYVQPKLDGHRCTSDREGNLWSRTRKPITGVPHISTAIKQAFDHLDTLPLLDGELYNHDYRNNFEDLSSFIRQQDPKEGHEVVQYHVYDIFMPGKTYAERWNWLLDNFPVDNERLILVPTFEINDAEELMDNFNSFTELGYEGAIVRNSAGLYLNKRSYDLQKVKEFDDAEFKIVDVKEGRGKLAGHAIFICETDKGKTFDAKLKGPLEYLKTLYEDSSLWEGKLLTVQHQGWTNDDKPRFCVGLRIREDI